MIQSLDALKTPSQVPHTIAVAVAQDSEVLTAVEEARRLGLANAVLVGEETEIRRVAESLSIPIDQYTIVHELCHLLRMDHSPQFHQLVEENLPGSRVIASRMRHESPVRN